MYINKMHKHYDYLLCFIAFYEFFRWPITESILFGSILLYISVILKIEIPSNTALLCLLEPWARELGFTLVYGGILLKIYRQEKSFIQHFWKIQFMNNSMSTDLL